MYENKARQLSLELMEKAEAAILTTIDAEGFPHTRAMFNLRKKEQFPGLLGLFQKHSRDFLVYFTTNTSSSKITQIRNNPKASVYYCKPDEWRGLMLSGEAKIITDKKVKEDLWQDGWRMYYQGGVHDPDHTILCLRPIYAKYYHQLDGATFYFPEP
ncbi:MAG TPA: pyridoxamine 5'-phosphate oxidase family protein [Candidatus Methanoperedens sp.]